MQPALTGTSVDAADDTLAAETVEIGTTFVLDVLARADVRGVFVTATYPLHFL